MRKIKKVFFFSKREGKKTKNTSRKCATCSLSSFATAISFYLFTLLFFPNSPFFFICFPLLGVRYGRPTFLLHVVNGLSPPPSDEQKETNKRSQKVLRLANELGRTLEREENFLAHTISKLNLVHENNQQFILFVYKHGRCRVREIRTTNCFVGYI